MAKIDLSKMKLDELKKHREDVEKAIADYETRQRADALKAMEAAAKEFGYSVDELVGVKGKSKPKGPKAAPKFRHPENPEMTWTGRGPQPKWLKEQLAAGKSKEDFAI